MGRTERDMSGEGTREHGPAWREPRAWGSGEDPLSWSFPLGRLGRLRLRAHFILPIWLAAEMVAWVPRDAMGLVHVSAAVVSVIFLALVRELARAWMLRLQGTEQELLVLWPFGGLAPTPNSPTPRPLMSELGGLLANAVLVPVLGALVLWSGAGWESLLHFEPLSPRVAAADLRSLPQVWAWWAYYGNGMLLLANAVLPMSPMDAGRIVQAWARRARDGAESSVLRWGIFTGGALFVIGAASGESRVLALGAFGALATYFDSRRAEFVRTPLRTGEIPQDAPPDERDQEDLLAISRHRPTPDDHRPQQPSLDEVLSRISREGIESLSEEERAVLRRETERRRRR